MRLFLKNRSTVLLLLTGVMWIAMAAPTAFGVITNLKLNRDQVQEAFRPRKLALLVGIKDFQDPAFTPLAFPVKDAEDFERFLKGKEDGDGELPFDYVEVLTNTNATAANIIAALDRLQARNTSSEDTVVVYFSTHGTLGDAQSPGATKDSGVERYLVTHDTHFDEVVTTGIPVDFLQNRLARMRSHRKAMILALCHSGAGKSKLPEALQKELATLKAPFFAPPLHEVSTAMMILSASAWGQPARENEELKNDIYTHFLLEGLRTNDSNGDGGVSLFEAHEYARSKTYDFTRGRQTPTALMNLEGSDPIILKGTVRQESGPLVFADNDSFRNLELVVDGTPKGTLWQPKNIAPGRRRLTLLDPRAPGKPLLDHHIYLQADNTYSVSRLLDRRPAVGLETLAVSLPLPRGLDDSNQSLMPAAGIGLRFTDIFGKPFQMRLQALMAQDEGRMGVTGEVIPTKWRWTSIAASGFRTTYFNRNLQWNNGAGVEQLTMERTLASDFVANSEQSLRVLFPYFHTELRQEQIWGGLYGGVDLRINVQPMTRFTLADKELQLSLVTPGLHLGTTF